MGFLQGYLEGVYHAELVVLSLPSEGTGRGPSLDYQVVGFFETFAVEQGVSIGGQTLHTRTPNEPRHQPPSGDHVDFGQLLRQSNWIVKDGQGVAQQHNLGLFGYPGEDGRL